MSAEIHQKWIELQLSQFDLNRWSLSPEGADLLRRTRDTIVKNPVAFDMDLWDCGTTACIGGHMCRFLNIRYNQDQDSILAKHCGMDLGISHGSFYFEKHNPLWWLFFSYQTDDLTIEGVTRRINGFLNYFGYPDNESEEITDGELSGAVPVW